MFLHSDLLAKHAERGLSIKNYRTKENVKNNLKFPVQSASNCFNKWNTHYLSSKSIGRFSPECPSHSDTTTCTVSENPFLKPFENLSLDSLESALFKLTPHDICKWSLVFSIAIAASKWSLNILFGPFVWMYFSWTWLFWPWMVAISLALYGLYCLNKHLRGEANTFEQLSIVTSAFTWLTLVSPSHFNGFLEGFAPGSDDWPWLAVFEGPELPLVPGGWSNVGIWILIMSTLFMQYHSTLYLSKYSQKVVVPTAVVQFGPYRFVRHPIYASMMLLFVTYFAALRAPLSALFNIAVCLMYYGQKAKLEKILMVDTFGEKYSDYTRKVTYRFIPFVY